MADDEEPQPQPLVVEEAPPAKQSPPASWDQLSMFLCGNTGLSVKGALFIGIIMAALIIIIILMAVIPNDFNLCEGCNDGFADPKTSHFKAPDTPLLYEGDTPQHKPQPIVPCKKTPEMIMPPAYDDDNREEKMQENKIREKFRQMKKDAAGRSQKLTDYDDHIQTILANTSSQHVNMDRSGPASDLHELGDIARDQLHRSSSRNRQNTTTSSHRWNAENFHQSSR